MTIRRCVRFLAAIGVAGLAAFGVAAVSLAAQGSAVIRACVSHEGDVRIIGPGDSCRPNQTLVTWNTAGPAGASGPTGPAGPAGPAGTDGANGHDGRDGRDAIVAGPPPPTVVLDMALDTGAPTPIMNFSFGETNATTIGSATGGAGAGKVSFSNVTVNKLLDAVSVQLLGKAATGTHFSKVTIRAFNVGDSTPFAIYQFDTVFVGSDVIGGNGNSLNETVMFIIGSITADVSLGGTVYHSCWDVVRNASC